MCDKGEKMYQQNNKILKPLKIKVQIMLFMFGLF